MKDTTAAFVWWLTAIAFWLSWLAVPVLQIPQLWYFPLTREVTLFEKPAGIAMGLFGQLLFAAVVAGAVFLGTWIAVRRRELPAFAVMVAGVVVLCGAVAYYAAEMWGRVPH